MTPGKQQKADIDAAYYAWCDLYFRYWVWRRLFFRLFAHRHTFTERLVCTRCSRTGEELFS